jgi:hypothetical protein
LDDKKRWEIVSPPPLHVGPLEAASALKSEAGHCRLSRGCRIVIEVELGCNVAHMKPAPWTDRSLSKKTGEMED